MAIYSKLATGHINGAGPEGERGRDVPCGLAGASAMAILGLVLLKMFLQKSCLYIEKRLLLANKNSASAGRRASG